MKEGSDDGRVRRRCLVCLIAWVQVCRREPDGCGGFADDSTVEGGVESLVPRTQSTGSLPLAVPREPSVSLQPSVSPQPLKSGTRVRWACCKLECVSELRVATICRWDPLANLNLDCWLRIAVEHVGSPAGIDLILNVSLAGVSVGTKYGARSAGGADQTMAERRLARRPPPHQQQKQCEESDCDDGRLGVAGF